MGGEEIHNHHQKTHTNLRQVLSNDLALFCIKNKNEYSSIKLISEAETNPLGFDMTIIIYFKKCKEDDNLAQTELSSSLDF